MTAVTITAIAVPAVLAVLAVALLAARLRRPASSPGAAGRPAPPPTGTLRILFPFVAHALSPRALDAALRLARVQEATIVPVFLACVSLDLPLDAAIVLQAADALSLQEAIDQRAAVFGVPVEARIERGRTHRHALRRAIEQERFDQIVIAAAHERAPGFTADVIAWLLDTAPGEIVVLRPSVPAAAPDARRRAPAEVHNADPGLCPRERRNLARLA